MKPSSFILALLCASSMLLCSCEPNDPETKKGGDDTASLHQPADPATWSPVGHRYICNRSSDNPYGYEYFVEVIDFFKRDSAVMYGTINHDLSPMEKCYNPARYKMNYPKVIMTFGIDERECTFTDTLTLFDVAGKHILVQD